MLEFLELIVVVAAAVECFFFIIISFNWHLLQSNIYQVI